MWYDITKKYNRVKYKQGGWNIKEGLDCISMILLLFKEIGMNVDDYIEGKKGFVYNGNLLTANNFLDYLSNPDEINVVLRLFIQEICVKVNKMQKGDVCFFKYKNVIPAAGLYLGQGTVMCSFAKLGIKNLKLRNFEITEIYRCQLT